MKRPKTNYKKILSLLTQKSLKNLAYDKNYLYTEQ